jgi:hypothetical protein
MTAEIAILNTGGLALAADSAVTVSTPQGRKSLHRANKLFGLSKHEPVAVMTYNNAVINGIPWETLLKLYRKELGATAHDSLETYSSRLVEFLGNNTHFTEELQADFFENLSRSIFRTIRTDLEKRIEHSLEADQEIHEGQAGEVFGSVVEEWYEKLRNADRFEAAPDELPQQLLAVYENTIAEAVVDVFGSAEMPEAAATHLRELPALWFASDFFGDNATGIVVAGFGDTEIYPSYVELLVEGVAGGHLKWGIRSQRSVSPKEPVCVRPFAQREMVDTFMQGLNPEYEQVLNRAVGEAFRDYADRLVEAIPGVTDSQREAVRSTAQEANETILTKLFDGLKTFRNEEYVQPIVETVGALAKDELAEMAEALVSLTSLKRRVSESVETVGGPIDVAVITKGDGLVWIRRKHYFDPSLNPMFFSTYFER